MRKLLAVFILLPFISFAQNDKVCHLKGHISGLGNEMLTFYHSVNDATNPTAKDTVWAHGGDFTFTAHLSEPTYYTILYIKAKDNKNGQRLIYETHVFLENGNMTIKGKLTKLYDAEVKGSVVNDEWSKVSKMIDDKEAELTKAAIGQRGTAENKKDKDIELNKEEMKVLSDFKKAYIVSHPNSYPSLQLIRDEYRYNVLPAESGPLFKGLDEKVRGSVTGLLFQQKLDLAIKTDIGQPALEVTLPDADGKNISLSSFKGKVVLLDFWASWCGPCRRENPNVVRAYRKYHDKGFDIFGVSLDEKKEPWLKAIEKDSLTWTHVSDLKGWQCAAGKLYGVQGIPFNLLIDRNGMIVGKNLHREELFEMLEKVVR